MTALSPSDVKVALEALKVEDVPATLGTNGEREQQWIYGFIAGQKAMKRKSIAIFDAQEAVGEFEPITDCPHDPQQFLAFLESAGQGCISGNVREWPQLKPACAWAASQLKQPAQPPVDFVMVPREFLQCLIDNDPDESIAGPVTVWDGLQQDAKRYLAAAPQSSGAMKPAENWLEEIDFVEGPDWNLDNKLTKDFIKRIQQDALASQQPAPSGDAREVAHAIMGRLCAEITRSNESMNNQDYITQIIQSFGTATREKALAESTEWKDEDDKPLPEDAEIEAAHPVNSKSFKTYDEAMRLVGARRSKAGLVALVNWILCKQQSVRGCESVAAKEAPSVILPRGR